MRLQYCKGKKNQTTKPSNKIKHNNNNIINTIQKVHGELKPLLLIEIVQYLVI